MSDTMRWWQTGVIYQVVVPSFLDTNGDGLGDLRGVTERLEYLQWLGVQAIWLSPIYPSPMADLGYDATDFLNIDPRFGTLADFDELVSEAHRRDLRIILDCVPNHTSDEHPWFVESRSSRDNPKRDWYVWRDGRPDGSEPTNWISVFGGSVWQWDEHTGQYYMHHFLEKQPDLNWRNRDVRRAMLDTFRFWLDRGVDGFRIDALDLLLEDEKLRDNPPNPNYVEGQGPDSQQLPKYTRDQPGCHDMVAMMRAVVDQYGDDKMLAGELYLPFDQVVSYYGGQRPELHLPLNLRLAWTEWNAEAVRQTIAEYQQQLPPHGWPTWTVSTHDCPRLAARCQGEQTRLAALLLLTLRGTPTHYYGEEIGMRGTPIPPHDAKDPQGRRTGRNRDPERTPMQWSAEQHAGFSTAEPWLPVSEDFTTANVFSQSANPQSLLTLYRRLLSLRRDDPVLIGGRQELLDFHHPLLVYQRVSDHGTLLIALNLQGDTQTVPLGEPRHGRIVLSTFLDRDDEPVQDHVALRGDEGIIVRLGA